MTTGRINQVTITARCPEGRLFAPAAAHVTVLLRAARVSFHRLKRFYSKRVQVRSPPGAPPCYWVKPPNQSCVYPVLFRRSLRYSGCASAQSLRFPFARRVPRRHGFTNLVEDYISTGFWQRELPYGASTSARPRRCGSSIVSVLPVGLAIGKYIHKFHQCDLT